MCISSISSLRVRETVNEDGCFDACRMFPSHQRKIVLLIGIVEIIIMHIALAAIHKYIVCSTFGPHCVYDLDIQCI